MREIAEIELAIQGGTEKIETLGMSCFFELTVCLDWPYAQIAYVAGEQGKVDESMREMAAIEALKSEKSDKEVRVTPAPSIMSSDTEAHTFHSGSCSS